MPSHSAMKTAEMPPNPVASKPVPALVAPIDLTDAEVLATIRQAIVETFGSHKAAAITFGVHPAKLSRWLAGTERLPAVVFRHEPLFHSFARLMLERRGYVVQRSDRWTWLTLRVCRMARAMLRRVEVELERDVREVA